MFWAGLGPIWGSHETRAAGANARFENQAFQNQQVSIQSATRYLSHWHGLGIGIQEFGSSV
jgi:hypothetical protein